MKVTVYRVSPDGFHVGGVAAAPDAETAIRLVLPGARLKENDPYTDFVISDIDHRTKRLYYTTKDGVVIFHSNLEELMIEAGIV